jgi:hypothetical protein
MSAPLDVVAAQTRARDDLNRAILRRLTAFLLVIAILVGLGLYIGDLQSSDNGAQITCLRHSQNQILTELANAQRHPTTSHFAYPTKCN